LRRLERLDLSSIAAKAGFLPVESI
jgi:hypothetical protein